MHELYRLDNGTNVLLVPKTDTKAVTVLVVYPVGSRYEPEKLNGVSHYIEHLMFKGTTKRKNTQILTREIDRLGAEYNAFTGKEMTAYYIKVDAKYLPIALDILSDMLHHSLFDPKEMEREKPVIVEELRMYEDNPLMNIDTIFEHLLYQGSSLGWDIGGTPKHVLSYPREKVLAFRDRHYGPGRGTVIVAGNIVDGGKLLLEQYFGAEKSGKSTPQKFPEAVFGSKKKSDRIVVKKKETDQAQLMLGFPGFTHTDPRNVVGTVLHTILGGSMSSRLFIQIRERRGLAYMVRSGMEHFHDVGYSFVRAGLEVKNINKAIEVVTAEIEKLKKSGVTARELRDAKTHIRGALTLSLEDASAEADWYSREYLFQKDIETPEEWLKKIDAITEEEIVAVAQESFALPEMRVAVIGNVDQTKIRF